MKGADQILGRIYVQNRGGYRPDAVAVARMGSGGVVVMWSGGDKKAAGSIPAGVTTFCP